MKEARVYLWSGRALVFGVSIDSTPHAHYAAQLSLALEGSFRVTDARGGVRRVRHALFAPGEVHRIEAGPARLAHLFVDPEGREVRRFFSARATGVAGELHIPRGLRASLEALSRTTPGLDEVREVAERWLTAWLARDTSSGEAAQTQHDERVAQALASLEARTGTVAAARLRIDGATLAAQVGLSESRFAHLFTAHTGMPLRRYLLWRRLLAAVEALGRGANVTDAALDAGFADTAHMSRVFRSTFGVKASDLARARIIPAG